MNEFQPVRELKFGHIVEISGTTVKVEISGDVLELTRSFSGRVYPLGQIGSVVKVHFGRRLVFGFVTLLRMRSEENLADGTPIPPEADQRLMEIELFAEGTWNSAERKLIFVRGVSTFPLPLQGVFLLTREESELLYSAAEGQRSNGFDPLVGFATYVGSDATVCRANIDRTFGMHCAVLGSTGSGKSGAVAAILHGVLEHMAAKETPSHPRIVVIDPHGEYGAAFKDRAVVYRAYDPIGIDKETVGTPIKLPYWLMSADEFRSLTIGKTEEEATSQNNIIYKALTHARMVVAGLVDAAPKNYNGTAPTDGNPPDYPRPKSGVESSKLINFDRDKPRPFSISELVNHILYLQAARIKDGKLERVTETDFSKYFKSILDKISVLSHDPRIRFLMEDLTSQTPSLEEVISQFVGSPGSGSEDARDIRILDLSGLPNEVAGPLSAMVARLLFQYKLYQTGEERRKDPILLVCEEAHRYVPDKGEAEYSAAQNAIRRIAREGRKYGVGLMLVSQRPADIEGTVISQCGTWVVLRLTNTADQQHVARFLPDGLSGMTRSLPSLGQQEAIFVGEGAALPARIKIRTLAPEQRPKSETIAFAGGWTNQRLSKEEVTKITNRMAGVP